MSPLPSERKTGLFEFLSFSFKKPAATISFDRPLFHLRRKHATAVMRNYIKRRVRLLFRERYKKHPTETILHVTSLKKFDYQCKSQLVGEITQFFGKI
ncbi:MAG: hypothetical protein A2293_02070 [Elusimicrobia bacterium RIFOXYB2_FULL_49_7]|nr:MAG: hypothetical protein A2293_02070 [Elusimicrobia bacterium RIFOXYB2_FULL_49_7]